MSILSEIMITTWKRIDSDVCVTKLLRNSISADLYRFGLFVSRYLLNT